MASSWANLGMMLQVLAAALLFPAALSTPDELIISMTTDGQYHSGTPPVVTIADDLTPDYYDVSCPGVRDMVRSAVVEAIQGDATIAKTLLRMFFHDCFPLGCDASILLLESQNSEMWMEPNQSLDRNHKVAFLMEDIRAKVHAVCGHTVSCADIMALATHDAVVASGGQTYEVKLGRLDGWPADERYVDELPRSTFNIDQLITSFSSRSLDDRDLVVLSGAHTIGKAACPTFSHRFDSENSDFVRRLRDNCNSGHFLQDLDVVTPDTFDNKYHGNLVNGEGVLYSDVQLLVNQTTREYVNNLAVDHYMFWHHFGDAMTKMGNLRGPQGDVGVIRQRCY